MTPNTLQSTQREFKTKDNTQITIKTSFNQYEFTIKQNHLIRKNPINLSISHLHVNKTTLKVNSWSIQNARPNGKINRQKRIKKSDDPISVHLEAQSDSETARIWSGTLHNWWITTPMETSAKYACLIHVMCYPTYFVHPVYKGWIHPVRFTDASLLVAVQMEFVERLSGKYLLNLLSSA